MAEDGIWRGGKIFSRFFRPVRTRARYAAPFYSEKVHAKHTDFGIQNHILVRISGIGAGTCILVQAPAIWFYGVRWFLGVWL